MAGPSSKAGRASNDAVLSRAIDFARAAAIEAADSPEDVGAHAGVRYDDERLVSHLFSATMAGYPGWQWVVTLARVPRGRSATLCEVSLLPADGALLAPKWVPWSERLQPGDIRPGDVLPFLADDRRLTPGFTPTGDPQIDAVAIDELALARTRVLSPEGRAETAQRWYDSSHGPKSELARKAADKCRTCAFFVPLTGPLGSLFGACANEWAPDDGLVVSVDHGCGAHSESDVAPMASLWPNEETLIDEFLIEVVDLGEPTATPTATESEAATDSAAAPVNPEHAESAEGEPSQADPDPTPAGDAGEGEDRDDDGGH
ncbi:MAG: DUF3027 domain-containing protein [Promicromonosporaceae bacterium]|nr:DUF3027 domain-containing protein [Promicromonosporaceae bacterium]